MTRNLDIYTIACDGIVAITNTPHKDVKKKAKDRMWQSINRSADYDLVDLEEKGNTGVTGPNKYEVTFKITDSIIAENEGEAIDQFKKTYKNKPFYEIVDDSITIESVEPGGDVL